MRQCSGINPIATKKNEIELRILAAMDSCFGLVRPRQHGIANTELKVGVIYAMLTGHLAALTRSHLIGDHPSGLTKEQTETMDPSPKTKGLRPYPRH